MSLFLAQLLPGLLLLAIGVALTVPGTVVRSTLTALPRSRVAANLFYGLGAVWFLYNVWHLSPADFGDYRKLLFAAFGIIAVGSYIYVTDFLAVRGLAILMLLAAGPLLHATFMNFHYYVYPLNVGVYVGILLALWLGASPFRMRDFFEWLFRKPGRSMGVGASVAVYGLVLCSMAFVA